MNFLLIDGSYYIFFRYFALLNWWRFSGKAEEGKDPHVNEEFTDRFDSVFVSKIDELRKKLKMKDCVTIVGRDCPRHEIWRMSVLPQYKGNRDKDGDFETSLFFTRAYRQKLFEASGATVLKHDHLEADDCLAITARHILATYPDASITIIASDMDYLQLAGPRLRIMDLKYNDLSNSKGCTGDCTRDLFYKIVCGDKSDNIPGVFKKCGPKTASALYDDKAKFIKKLKDEDAEEAFARNQILVDFDNIPSELVDSFRTNVLGLKS